MQTYKYSKECVGSCKHSVCLMLQSVKLKKLHQNLFFAGCVCDVQIKCDWFNAVKWFLAPYLSTETDNHKSLGLNAWTVPEIRP